MCQFHFEDSEIIINVSYGILISVTREERITESPLVLRSQELSQPPEFTEPLTDIVRLLEYFLCQCLVGFQCFEVVYDEDFIS